MENGTQKVIIIIIIIIFGSTPYKVSNKSNIKEYDLT